MDTHHHPIHKPSAAVAFAFLLRLSAAFLAAAAVAELATAQAGPAAATGASPAPSCPGAGCSTGTDPAGVMPEKPNEAQSAPGSPTQLARERARRIIEFNQKVTEQVLERARRASELLLARGAVTTAALSGRGGFGRIAPPGNLLRVTTVAELDASLTFEERCELDKASGQVPMDPIGLGAGPVASRRRGTPTSQLGGPCSGPGCPAAPPAAAAPAPSSAVAPASEPPAKQPSAPPLRYGEDPERPGERAPRR